MIHKLKPTKTSLLINESYRGERIEEKVRRISTTKEPINDSKQMQFTERKDGIKPEHDIRTDTKELAVIAMDKVAKSNILKREGKLGKQAKEGMEKEAKTESGKPEPTQGTGNQ